MQHRHRRIRTDLFSRRTELERRSDRIRSDRRRTNGPLDADSAEQAIELENDQVLDALDASIWSELGQIRDALSRIEQGDFGSCARCDAPISIERLGAVPTTALCSECATRGTGRPGDFA
jgi:RNA polymerase-binding transcription factor DksA